MNKKIAIPAIAMFAVTLGLGLMGPALADNPHSKVQICHFQDTIFNQTDGSIIANATWVPIDVDNKGALKGHFIDFPDDPRHVNATSENGDFVIDDNNPCPEGLVR